jgi:gliding motility-associated-like protein
MEIFVSLTKKSFVQTYKFILFTLFFITLNSNSLAQSVSVNDTKYTANALVDLLVSNNCVTTSDYKLSSNKSVAYFNNNNSNFPLKEGIIIRNGIAKNSEGKFLDNKLSSQLNTNIDQDLNDISNTSGQNAKVTDIAFLSFDFISQSSEFDFNFIFGSNEYGEWQCGVSDLFGFILTDLSTGEKTNLAVLPNSNDIISVKSIRDTAYNTSCNSVNPTLFNTFNTLAKSNESSLNMRGYTKILNASSKIEANKKYNLKLVIGDSGDSNFDSAVFIAPGIFNKSFHIGEDFTMCENEPFTIDTDVAKDANFTFKWYKDGEIIQNENQSSYSGNKLGTYKVVANNDSGCEFIDEINISQLKFNKQPDNLFECDNGFNTSFNIGQYDIEYFNLDKDKYELEYYNSLENIDANNAIAKTNLNYYLSAGNETIYIKLKSRILNNLCEDLIISFTLNAIQFETKIPNDIEVCQSSLKTINIPQLVNTEILDGLNSQEHTVTFYADYKNAQDKIDAIANASSYPINEPKTTALFARTESKFNINCFDIVEFNVNIIELPKVDSFDDVTECEEFMLPALENGQYFSASNGTGSQFFPGEVLENTQAVYIFNQNENGCTNETKFIIRILDDFELNDNYCENFTVFDPPNGHFYTAPGGVSGDGKLLVSGTKLTESQTIYYYATVNKEACKDKAFDVVVIPRPKVDNLEDVTTCTSFILPELNNGDYFTGSNGTGNKLSSGTEISKNQRIYIYNETQNCGNQTSFNIFKVDVNVFKDVVACGSHTLPKLNVGGYYTAPNAQGDNIAEGTVITASQQIYYFAETIENNNCTTELSFQVDVFPIPEVDTLESVIRCINEPYILPELTHGQYFTQSKGKGSILNAGDIITDSITIYIYNKNEVCDAETNFNVEIRFLPKADVFTDVFACKPFVLPVLKNGNYFTEPGGQGEELKAGDIIAETKTIYIYSIDEKLEGCTNENIFTVEYLGIKVDKLDDIKSCDSYTLPILNIGEYYTKRNGQGTKMYAGDIITEDLQLYIYAENGGRFFCSDQHLFTIEISTTPVALAKFDNIESCASYTLQERNTISNHKFEFYRQPNKVDLIRPEDYTITAIGTQTIYAVESALKNKNCYVEESFQLTIYPLLDLMINDVIICKDYDTNEAIEPVEIKSGLDPNKFTADWFFNNELVGTGVNYMATEIGTYRIEPQRITPEVGSDCNYNPTEVNVLSTSPKAKITYISDAFTDKTSVRVDFISYGLSNYMYKIDDNDFQGSNEFTAIETGIHTITIRDTNGFCPDFSLTFTALSYPKYFSPNADGVNDFWNIKDLKDDPNALVKVYNRYGILIAAFKASEQGWNGYQQGKLSPENSYWFKVNFTFKKQPTDFKSYFLLKRN